MFDCKELLKVIFRFIGIFFEVLVSDIFEVYLFKVCDIFKENKEKN